MTIETRYGLGDTVFSLVSHKIESHVINSIKLSVNYHGDGKSVIRYRLRGDGTSRQSEQWWVEEKNLFPTKEALIQSL